MSATQQQTANPLETASYEEVITIIRHWPQRMRASLVHDVIDTLAELVERIEDVEIEERPRRKKDTFSRARGLLKTDRPAPTDKEIKQWLDERRIERYG